VIAGTIAGYRQTKDSAYDIAKTIIRDLKYFGYDIQPKSNRNNFMHENDKAES
jgi:hypothetical protein